MCQESIECNYENESMSAETNYSLGVEFKRARLRLGLTLKDVSDNICSPSYLCKIENSVIYPSASYYKPLCERLELKESSRNYLYSLNIHLYACVKAFTEGNYDIVNEIYIKTKPMDNHYSDLITIFYSFTLGKYFSSKKLIKSIFKCIVKEDRFAYKTLLVCDAIVRFETGDTKEVCNLLTKAKKVMVEYYLDVLILEYTFYAQAESGSHYTLITYQEVIKKLDENFTFPRFDKVLTNLIFYYLATNRYNMAFSATKGIRMPDTKNNILYVYYMHVKQFDKALLLKEVITIDALKVSAAFTFGGDLKTTLENYAYKEFPNPRDTYVKYIDRLYNLDSIKESINPLSLGIEESVNLSNDYLLKLFSKKFIELYNGNERVVSYKKYSKISKMIIENVI